VIAQQRDRQRTAPFLKAARFDIRPQAPVQAQARPAASRRANGKAGHTENPGPPGSPEIRFGSNLPDNPCFFLMSNDDMHTRLMMPAFLPISARYSSKWYGQDSEVITETAGAHIGRIQRPPSPTSITAASTFWRAKYRKAKAG
jgi:hypothetical protein